jgi:hypothetical protein
MVDADQLAGRFALLSGCVNARPFRGKAAGTLLFAEGRIERLADGSAAARVLLLHDAAGWNNLPYGGKRYPAVDRKGDPPYVPANFPAADGLVYVIEERKAEAAP